MSNNTKKLDVAIAQLEKDYGKGVIIKGNEKVSQCEVIPTGSLGLDIATGVGGYPRGRIVEIYGPESSGKTTLCLHAIKEAQKLGGRVAFIDMEHSLDTDYAKRLGVDIDNLYFSQPDYGEQALNVIITLAKTEEFSLIVLDSIAALVPKSELEGEVGDASPGRQARMMSQSFRMMIGYLEKTNTLLIMTNQIRMKIGVMFGNPETTAGGEAAKFYASMRLDVRRQLLKDGEDFVGGKTAVRIKKNKVAAPFKKAEFDITFGEGIDRIGEILDFSVELGIVQKSGSWYSYDKDKLGQGKASVKQLLKDNEELLLEIEKKIMAKLREQNII